MKKTAKELMVGDVIPAPAHERKWLKNPLTVLKVWETMSDGRGEWLMVEAEFQSPYGPNRSTMKFRIQPETMVSILKSAFAVA